MRFAVEEEFGGSSCDVIVVQLFRHCQYYSWRTICCSKQRVAATAANDDCFRWPVLTFFFYSVCASILRQFSISLFVVCPPIFYVCSTVRCVVPVPLSTITHTLEIYMHSTVISKSRFEKITPSPGPSMVARSPCRQWDPSTYDHVLYVLNASLHSPTFSF